MKNLLFISFILILASACSNNNKTSINEHNQTEEQENSKMTDTLDQLFAIESEAELIEIYGEENVRFDTVYGGEGEMSMATLLFPESNDQLEILWGDMKKRENMINITHYAYYDMEEDILSTESRWKTSYGIVIGTTMMELEALNEAPITFMGFGWDYGGMVSDLNDGKLYDSPLMLQLGMVDFNDLYGNADYEALVGDAEFSSENEAAQNLNPVVILLSISKERY